MNIPSTELRKSLKVLSPIRSESYVIGNHGVFAGDTDAQVYVKSALSELGTFSVNGKNLAKAVNRLSGNIELDKQDKFLSLKNSKAEVKLEVQNVKPLKIPEPPKSSFSVSAKDFQKALGLVLPSVSPNKSKPFGGVLQIQSLGLGIEDESAPGYRIVGTDGDILTVVKVLGSVPEFKTLLNLEAAGVVQIMDGDLSFGESDKQLWVFGGDITLIASKPVQVYPNFDPILSAKPKAVFQFDPAEWLSAVKTAELLVENELDEGSISLHFQEGVVVFRNVGVGNTSQDEATYEQIEPDVFEPITVSNLQLRPKNLSSFLSKATNPSYMSLTDKRNPVKFEYGDVSALMMPVTKKETK